MSDAILNSSFASADDVPSVPFMREEIGPISTVYESISGSDQAYLHTTRDRMKYTINLMLYTRTERDAIREFFRQRQGQYDTFLFKDPEGYDVAKLRIGTGDGAETDFQIKEGTWGGIQIDRKDIEDGTLSVWVNTVLQTEGAIEDYTVDYLSGGIITFNAGSIPGAVAVEVEYEYYRRCRLLSNYRDITRHYVYPDIPSLQIIEKIVKS